MAAGLSKKQITSRIYKRLKSLEYQLSKAGVGHIMLKCDYKFNPRLKFGPATQSSGWKLYRKLKKDATMTAEQFAAKMVADINTGRYTSWKIEEVSLRLQITSPSVDAVKA